MSGPTLDCQTCGRVLRVLTLSEARKVAVNPHNYIIDCSDCLKEITP